MAWSLVSYQELEQNMCSTCAEQQLMCFQSNSGFDDPSLCNNTALTQSTPGCYCSGVFIELQRVRKTNWDSKKIKKFRSARNTLSVSCSQTHSNIIVTGSGLDVGRFISVKSKNIEPHGTGHTAENMQAWCLKSHTDMQRWVSSKLQS